MDQAGSPPGLDPVLECDVGRGEGGQPAPVQRADQQRCQQSPELVLLPHPHTAVVIGDGHGVLDLEDAQGAQAGHRAAQP